MKAYIFTDEEIKKVVSEAVSETMKKQFPNILRRATRKKWITTEEVMEILKCSRRHVQHLRDAGKIPFSQTGRIIRYDIDEIENYLNQGKVKEMGQ